MPKYDLPPARFRAGMLEIGRALGVREGDEVDAVRELCAAGKIAHTKIEYGRRTGAVVTLISRLAANAYLRSVGRPPLPPENPFCTRG